MGRTLEHRYRRLAPAPASSAPPLARDTDWTPHRAYQTHGRTRGQKYRYELWLFYL